MHNTLTGGGGVTTLTNAVWAILGVNLSRPGNLDHPPEFLGYISFDVPILFCNVPELKRVSRKNFQVSRFPEKTPDSRTNFGFVPKKRLLELSPPVPFPPFNVRKWKNDRQKLNCSIYLHLTVNPCTNNPCKNGGTCTVTEDDSYSCQCAEGFYGDSCEKGTLMTALYEQFITNGCKLGL